MNNIHFYWAPNVRWKTNDCELMIETIVFKGKYYTLFPEFYFLCSEGTTLERLVHSFPDYSRLSLINFITKLQHLNILIDRIQSPSEVFFSQERLFSVKNVTDYDYFMSSNNVDAYRNKCLQREVAVTGTKDYSVNSSKELGEVYTKRRSVRKFNINKLISVEQFEFVLESISQRHTNQGYNLYPYPSAGGLYPIDCYILIKENRVHGFEPGLYYFNPILKKLTKISMGEGIDKKCHYSINKDIFSTSAFSMFLFFNAEVSMPKYQGKAYLYGLLDAGIMIGYLNLAATEVGLSCCCIGDMKNCLFQKTFQLTDEQIFLHCIEFGNQ